MTTKPAPVAAPDEGIPSDTRRVIRRTVLELRKRLENDFRRQLAAWGISEHGVADEPNGLNESDARSREVAAAVIERERVVAGRGLDEAIDFFVSECAFTFLNRAYGLRCLEERKLLIVDGQTETAIHTDASSGSSSLYWRVRNSDGAPSEPRELWRATLRRACDAVSHQVRVLFDADAEEAALFPLLPTVQAVVSALNDAHVPADTYATDELLGWVYQYFNSERKDEVFAAAGKGKKIEGEDIVPATQIYTERYMVDFLLQNSLGRMYREMYPETKLPRWPYELTPHPDNPKVQRDAKPLAEVTIMDPAVGSGHFLLRAADLLFAMYEEQQPDMPREAVALSIIERNLYGIDLDLRAVQIAALALYMKASTYAGRPLAPQRINLVAADVQLPPAPPQEYLDRFQGDRQMEGLVYAIWESLRNVRELGSLIHPERPIDDVLAQRRAKSPLEMQDEAHWEQWKRDLLRGLRGQIEESTEGGTVGQRLLGEQTARGVGLVEALTRQYDLVCANPPYMGARNMGATLKDYAGRHYASAKDNLFACFIARCRELTVESGLTAMVTMQAWMFIKSYADLRAVPESKLKDKILAQGILRTASIEFLAHLGAGAFEEVTGEVVSCALFVLRSGRPDGMHRMTALRLVAQRSPALKAEHMRRVSDGRASAIVFRPFQRDFLGLPGAAIAYWLPTDLLRVASEREKLGALASVKQGLATGDDDRFLRFSWEITERKQRWFGYTKGGGYSKWWGFTFYLVDWEDDGARIKATGKGAVRNEKHYMIPGLTHGQNTGGSLSARILPASQVFGGKGPATHRRDEKDPSGLLVLLNSRFASYLLRAATSGMDFTEGYVSALPLPTSLPETWTVWAKFAVDLKLQRLSNDVLDVTFRDISVGSPPFTASDALLLALEGLCESSVFDAMQISETSVRTIVDEIGTPAGWFPLLDGYHSVRIGPAGLPNEVTEYLGALERQVVSPRAIEQVRERLRQLYSSGIESIDETAIDSTDARASSEAEDDSRVHMPFSSEFFLEDLSRRVNTHPISVFWILDEMVRNESIVCPTELQSRTGDFLTVRLLRILGYRWPMQDQYEKERGAPFVDPDWIDDDGIIPLTVSAGQRTLTQRLHDMLHQEFGEDAEADLCSTLGWKPGDDWGKQKPTTLERWFEREFFKRHVQQFKQRPIAWHFKSPDGHFQAFVLYHQLSYATLEKLRSTYAGATIQQLRAQQERAKSAKDDKEALSLQARIEDVEAFRDIIEKIQRGDMDGSKPTFRIRCRWKGEEKDGRPGPYAPEIDDGVKVNIRPFQEAGLLASKVINKW